ncbi:MAG: hypothetical protein M3Y91_18805 [Actinomycetota bacterium]|nr:hypothetical protein [Actinomycetota bacterium]
MDRLVGRECVTDGAMAALQQAHEAAGDKDLAIAGGVPSPSVTHVKYRVVRE